MSPPPKQRDSVESHRWYSEASRIDSALFSDRGGKPAEACRVLVGEIDSRSDAARAAIFVRDSGRQRPFAWQSESDGGESALWVQEFRDILGG